MNAIIVNNLTKKYDNYTTLNNLSFHTNSISFYRKNCEILIYFLTI